MSDSERYKTLIIEIPRSPGFEMLKQIDMLNIALDIFRGNYKELRNLVLFMSYDDKAGELLSTRKKDELRAVQIEIARHIHNTVASVKSLVENSRRFHRHYCKKAEMFKDYQHEVDRLFKDKPLPCFVEDLRNYCTHYKTPPIGVRREIHQGSTREERIVFIDKDRLSEYKELRLPSRRFLKSQERYIDVWSVFDSYNKLVLSFHMWFRRRLFEIYKVEIEHTAVMQRELAMLEIDGWLRIHDVNGTQFDLDQHFFQILGSTQIEKLEALPKDSQERCELLISNLSEVAMLTNIQKKRIRNAYGF